MHFRLEAFFRIKRSLFAIPVKPKPVLLLRGLSFD